MDYYIYSVRLPFSNTELYYRELKTKEQLILAKSNIFLKPGSEFDSDYAKVLQKIIKNCVENKEDFEKINLLDYFLFITKLRIVTIGDQLELYINNSESTDAEKITIDLNHLMKNVYDAGIEALDSNIIEDKKIQIVLGFPNIKSEFLLIDNSNENYIEKVLSTISEYITKITIENIEVDINSFSTNQKKEFYEKLPVSLRTKVQIKVLNMIKILTEKNIIGLESKNIIKFNFYNNVHQQLIRFFFSNDLRNIYRDYYILASKKINPIFVDNLSVSERKVFMSFVEEEMKAREENVSNMPLSPTNNGTGLQDLIDEFGG